MARQVSDARKLGNFIGLGMMIIGGISFGSTFVTFAMHFGDFSNFDSNARSDITRAVLGMALLIAGIIIRGVSAGGLAGSGVILDPEKAREDLEPFARMSGGLTKAAMDEAGIPLEKVGQLIDRLGTSTGATGGAVQKVIVIKCRHCGKLNDEDSKFCQECGKPM